MYYRADLNILSCAIARDKPLAARSSSTAFENLLATGGGDAKLLDNMQSYVVLDDNPKNMTFKQPARVVT
jgi:hypothetical protein